MQFEEFRTNVEAWAAARGIYEHSTAQAQLLKGASELGELADAAVKADIDLYQDSIGDLAVCLINVAHMANAGLLTKDVENAMRADLNVPPKTAQEAVTHIVESMGMLAAALLINRRRTTVWFVLVNIMAKLNAAAEVAGLRIESCFAKAWKEIKDRKGHMVPGGAFVKEED